MNHECTAAVGSVETAVFIVCHLDEYAFLREGYDSVLEGSPVVGSALEISGNEGYYSEFSISPVHSESLVRDIHLVVVLDVHHKVLVRGDIISRLIVRILRGKGVLEIEHSRNIGVLIDLAFPGLSCFYFKKGRQKVFVEGCGTEQYVWFRQYGKHAERAQTVCGGCFLVPDSEIEGIALSIDKIVLIYSYYKLALLFSLCKGDFDVCHILAEEDIVGVSHFHNVGSVGRIIDTQHAEAERLALPVQGYSARVVCRNINLCSGRRCGRYIFFSRAGSQCGNGRN